MKAILNTRDGLTKIIDIEIPYKFVQTIIGDYDYRFTLDKQYDTECYYVEETREKIDYGPAQGPNSGQ